MAAENGRSPETFVSNDLSDEAFMEALGRALWKKGIIVDIEGDFYKTKEWKV
jgi:hypothetical protein